MACAFVVLSGCSHLASRAPATADPCAPGRAPSSAGSRCGGAAAEKFAGSGAKFWVDTANNPRSGLNQATISTADGQILRQGPKEVALDRNQIVSLFALKYEGGGWNRGGTMIQGTPTEVILDRAGNPAYLIFANQPVRLLEFTAYMNVNHTTVIEGQGYGRHPQGFSTPIGTLRGMKTPLSEVPLAELREVIKSRTDSEGKTTLEFESGVVVSGVVERLTEDTSAKNVATVMTFKTGTTEVRFGNRILFRPGWGVYDMLLGPHITNPYIDARNPMYNPRDL